MGSGGPTIYSAQVHMCGEVAGPHGFVWPLGKSAGFYGRARYSPAMLVYSTQHSCNQTAWSPAPSCMGGLPWDDYKEQWGTTRSSAQWCQHVEKVSGPVNTSKHPNLSEECFLALFLWL